MTTLAELRQANLKEQKQSAAEAAPAAPPPSETSSAAVSPAPASSSNGHHAAPAPVAVPSPVVEAPKSPAPPTPSPEALQEARFFARVHETLAHKTTYLSGAKVTADMPPALFHRAKRYCLDHGNVTLRQVLLDLLTAYLEEEGY